MWWSASRGGGRKVDQRLRKRYGISSGTVQSVNSLRGAALIGGALLASRVRQEFPNTGITESHPKALLRALELDEMAFAEQFEIPTDWSNEHERDAAIFRSVRQGGVRASVADGTWRSNATAVNRIRKATG